MYIYKIVEKIFGPDNSFVIKAKPIKKGSVFRFDAGQYCFLQNPYAPNPHELRPFSIASSPQTKDYLEFCIKIYGDWTFSFSKIKKEDTLVIEGPHGAFIWDRKIEHAVFLVGGLGITPIISILRYLSEKKYTPQITLIYGNRDSNKVVYYDELAEINKKIPSMKIVHIFSHLPKNSSWTGYKGFITEDIIKKEGNLLSTPTFFIVGPPIFLAKMDVLLANLEVKKDNIKKELLSLAVKYMV